MAYTTIQEDTWDKVSYKVYGTEMNAGKLMEANTDQLGTFVFSAGIVLNTPTVKEEDSNLPPWR